MSKLARSITRDEIAAYQNAGVVLLRGIFNLPAINLLRRCIDDAICTVLPNTADDRKKGFGQHEGISSRLKEFRRFAINGPAPEIAAALLESDKIIFYGDQVYIKEPSTREQTAFHQDATFLEIDGDQCCVLWIPTDPVTLESGAMMYIRRSHREGKIYRPNTYIQDSNSESHCEPLPDIEAHLADYDIVHFDVEPGDVIVHHYRIIHGATGNASRYQVCRAASIYYCGDDIRVRSRPWRTRQSDQPHRLREGAPLDGADFPIAWRRRADSQAA